MKFEFSWQIFVKVSNFKVHQDSSNRSRVVPRGQTKPRVGFQNFAKAIENCPDNNHSYHMWCWWSKFKMAACYVLSKRYRTGNMCKCGDVSADCEQISCTLTLKQHWDKLKSNHFFNIWSHLRMWRWVKSSLSTSHKKTTYDVLHDVV